MAQVAQDEGVSQTVARRFRTGGKKTLAQRGHPLVKVLGLDEFTIHKGHGHYRLVISAPELGIALDVLPDRSKESLEAWFNNVARPGATMSRCAAPICGTPITRLRKPSCRMRSGL